MNTKVLFVLHLVLYLIFIILCYVIIVTYIDIGMQKLLLYAIAAYHGNSYLF